MIDRKALWISITAILAMIAAPLWRLSLLPDWHRLPTDGSASTHPINGLFLFIFPFALLVITVGFARKWYATGSNEAVQPWQRWSTVLVIAYCAIVGLFQAFIIARSLGYGLAIDKLTISRIVIATLGILLMATGNALPKLPWLSMRFPMLQLGPCQQNRLLRFSGQLNVGVGLIFVLLAIFLPLLPPKIVLPMILGTSLAKMAAMHWHFIKLRREPSPQ